MDMGLVIDEGDFGKLNSKDRDTLVYKNLIHQHRRLEDGNKRFSKIEGRLDRLSVTKLIGGLWLFALSVYTGFRKFIPI